MTSIKIVEIDEKDRPDLIEVVTIPGKPAIKQVAFTRQRMFVLSEKGDVTVFKIEEVMPEKDHFSGKQEAMGIIVLDKPMSVKDIKGIKHIACGSDHFLALDNKGKVWAMGDDTFGQCG
jgi:alpha-tubulin suppressor-like RCC1 family protein